jgi:tetratricopeptide (TPR) repeat protein
MRAVGSASGEAAALFHVGNAYWLAGNFACSLVLLRNALKLGIQTGNRLVEEHATLLLAVAAMRDGSRSEALSTLTSLAASGTPQLAHAAATVLADSSLRDGDFEQAISRASEAANGCSLMYRRMTRATLARAYLDQGDFRQAFDATEHAFREGGVSAFPHLTVDLLGSRARALLGCGERHAAEDAVREACRFRDSVAQGIDDAESRGAFRSRGRANRVLDQLAEIVGRESST